MLYLFSQNELETVGYLYSIGKHTSEVIKHTKFSPSSFTKLQKIYNLKDPIYWNNEQINFLKNNYAILPKSKIIETIKKPWCCICSKAKRLGAKRNGYLFRKYHPRIRDWTIEQITFLKNNYYNMPQGELVSKLGRNMCGIAHKAMRLKLKRNRKFIYDAKSLANYADNPTKRPEIRLKMAAIMKKRFKNKEYRLNFQLKRNKITCPEKQVFEILISLGFSENKDFFYNRVIRVPDGFLFPDFCFNDKKVIIEADGLYWHNNPEKEIKRDNRLIAAGFSVYHFSDKEIENEKEKVKIELRRLLCGKE